MKVRIGVGTGAGGLDGPGLAALADDIVEVGLDSLWLSEVLTGPGLDPLVGLSWAGAHNPRLKLGTTMLLPGRNPVRLAGQTGAARRTLGRTLPPHVCPRTHHRDPNATPSASHPRPGGAAIEEVLPLLRRLWAGEAVSHDGRPGRSTTW